MPNLKELDLDLVTKTRISTDLLVSTFAHGFLKNYTSDFLGVNTILKSIQRSVKCVKVKSIRHHKKEKTRFLPTHTEMDLAMPFITTLWAPSQNFRPSRAAFHGRLVSPRLGMI